MCQTPKYFLRVLHVFKLCSVHKCADLVWCCGVLLMVESARGVGEGVPAGHMVQKTDDGERSMDNVPQKKVKERSTSNEGRLKRNKAVKKRRKITELKEM